MTFDMFLNEEKFNLLDCENVCANKFDLERKNFLVRKCREYMAAYQIQQWWYHITMSPHYRIGRKMIEKRRLEVLEEE
jgi:hypothetical protein